MNTKSINTFFKNGFNPVLGSIPRLPSLREYKTKFKKKGTNEFAQRAISPKINVISHSALVFIDSTKIICWCSLVNRKSIFSFKKVLPTYIIHRKYILYPQSSWLLWCNRTGRKPFAAEHTTQGDDYKPFLGPGHILSALIIFCLVFVLSKSAIQIFNLYF